MGSLEETVVAVIGLGYVGLPFAVEQVEAGMTVVGIDANDSVLLRLQEGHSHIPDVSEPQLEAALATGRLSFSKDLTALESVGVIVICVPTPLSEKRGPELSFVKAVCDDIAKRLRPGVLVCLESTTYPGTTEEVLRPILETSGLKAEKDFFLVHSPERIDPGNPVFATRNTSKLVGGVGPESTKAAVEFYEHSIETVVPVASAAVAEAAKCYENTYRAVNIALVNEMAQMCDAMGLDVWDVLSAAFTKPFGIAPFWPGPGVGGHCIPIDPHYLEWRAAQEGFETRMIHLAGETNRSMPAFVRDKLGRAMGARGLRVPGKILLLGVAYKKDIDDCRESPAIDVLRELTDAGHTVDYHDPFVPVLGAIGSDQASVPLAAESLAGYDAAVITTDHSGVDYGQVLRHTPLVLDTRNAMSDIPDPHGKVVRL